MTSHVKIHAVTPRIQYVADGTLTEYEFPFAIFKTSDIDIYFGNVKQESDTYTVSEARHSDGGTVTFESAPSAGTIITIARNLSIERTSDFQEGSSLRANVLNDELDYQIACQQQIADNLNRSMVLPPYAANSNVNLTLPFPSAGKAIVWNSDGTNLENSTVEVNALESTLNGYKTSAETAASTAIMKAELASDKADAATTQAGIATTKATEATTAATTLINQLQTTKTVIETYSNGFDWYRLWSDGWIEQGGRIQLNGIISATNVRVNFLKPYTGTFCVIPASDAQTGYDVVVGWQATDAFSIGTIATASVGNCQWYACGY